MSKERALLERLMDHEEKEIQEEHIPTVIQALFGVDDALIDPIDDCGMFDFGNVSRATRLVYRILKSLLADRHTDVLEAARRAGSAVAVQSCLLKALDVEVERAQEVKPLSADEVTRLQTVWLDRVKTLSGEQGFADHAEFPRLLSIWKHWGESTEVRAWRDRVTNPDEGLLNFLPKFLWHTRSQTVGDWAVRLQPRLNPISLESYIGITATAARLQLSQRNGKVSDGAKGASIAAPNRVRDAPGRQEPRRHRRIW